MANARIKNKIPLEREIQLAVCQYLDIKKHFFWRNNNTPVYDPTRKVFRAMPKYAMKGVADIIVIWKGIAYFLEIKRPKEKQSEDQVEFQRRVNKAGAYYFVINDVSELQKLGF